MINTKSMKKDKNISMNGKKDRLLKFFIGAGVILFFIAIINFFSSPVKNVFFALSSPVQRTFWSAGESCSGILSSLATAGNLSRENQDLKDQIEKLDTEVASLQSIQQGNQAQSEVSSACQNNGFNLLMAGVVGLDDQDILSINKGSVDGISIGMPVINQQGALFGKISEVYKSFSKVMLISNKDSVISAKIQQEKVVDPTQLPAGQTPPPEIDGVVKGTGKLGVYLDLVPIDDTINKGDILVTSSLDGTFPKDLLIGTISNVQKNDQNPHQQAQVQPFLNVATDNLFVITNYKR